MIPRAAAARTITRSDYFAQGPCHASAPTPVEGCEVSEQSDSNVLLGDAILAPTLAVDQRRPSPGGGNIPASAGLFD